MGKSSRELNKAIKECYPDEVQETYDYYETTEEDIKKEEGEKIETIVMNIKSELTKYSQDNALPLCEYLDYNKIDQYINFILSK